MLVLGLDPSSTCTGYGLVRKQGRKLLYEDCGCFRSRPGASFAGRLQTMYDGVVALLSNLNICLPTTALCHVYATFYALLHLQHRFSMEVQVYRTIRVS